MTTPAQPLPAAKHSFSLVWFVPIIAFAVSAWLVHREFRARGPMLEIDFASGAGIQAGKTPLLHKGVTVGLVQEIALKPDLNGVTVRIELMAGAKALAAAGSEFWLVHPEIGLSGVRGLDTLLSGARIHARAGNGSATTRFRALDRAPINEDATPGRTFTLRTPTLASLNPGSGVYYREVRVGVIEQHALSPDSTHVLITLKIFEPYDRLIRPDTRFWNAGGISVKLGLTGAQLRSNSLESLVAGGVAFATPESSAPAAPAAAGTVFDLHEEHDKAWLKWQPKIDLSSPAS